MTDIQRTLSRGLADIVSDLELTQPTLVSLSDLRELRLRHQVKTPERELARRLRNSGWLLRTARSGVYEFAPGSHAGPYGHGDPFVALRAQLRSTPDLPARVSLLSSLWLHGWIDRSPTRHQVALPPGRAVPSGLQRDFDLAHFDPRLPAADHQRLPVEAPATVLVHLATRPAHVTNWSLVRQALPDLVDHVDAHDLRRELAQRPRSVQARLGYLITGVAAALVDDVGLARSAGVTWFGPRGKVVRFNSRWNVADTTLPFDPSALTGDEPTR